MDRLQGGCLCGGLRYAVAGEPTETGYCHCRMCQRSSGSAAVPWAAFPPERFAYEKGSPAVYLSSREGQREFCLECGSQIAFRGRKPPGIVVVNLGTLDAPERIAPSQHIWTGSRIPWFELRDELPRFEDAGPERPAT